MGPSYPSRQSLRAVLTRMRANKQRPQLPSQAPASRLPRKASPSHWLPLGVPLIPASDKRLSRGRYLRAGRRASPHPLSLPFACQRHLLPRSLAVYWAASDADNYGQTGHRSDSSTASHHGSFYVIFSTFIMHPLSYFICSLQSNI